MSPPNPNLAYAVKLIHATCCLSGSPSYIDDVHADLGDRGILRAIKDHDTPALFDWLIETLSFQGISDAVASDYIAQHGSVHWVEITEALARTASRPRLRGYWRFYDCQYNKGSNSCSEPSHVDACPLPRHPLRNGRLNQMAYSLFLFMRDIGDGDFVAWIDQQLIAVDSRSPDRLDELREAIVGPLRNVYGIADKVLAISLSPLLITRASGSLYGSKSARTLSPSTLSCIISCIGPAFFSGFASTTLTASAAISRADAPRLSG